MAIEPARSVSLQPYSGMATPAVASQFVSVHSQAELTEAVRYGQEQQWPVLLLGEGSNTVFQSDFDGLVIQNQIAGLSVLEEDKESVLLRVHAGENWHQLVAHSVAQGWYGIENLALIPGSVGAAPIQNIGAYGVELASVITHVEVLRYDTLECERLSVNDCQFGYRDSVFKHRLKNSAAVTAVEMRLKKNGALNLSYAALKDYLGVRPVQLVDVFDAVCEIRRAKLPLPSQIPNCGSFFKNPVISEGEYDTLKAKYPDVVAFPAGQAQKIAAAWLIEKAGWKERSHHGVGVHQQQALVIINPQHSSGERVIAFANRIREDIQARFGITLEIEPQII